MSTPIWTNFPVTTLASAVTTTTQTTIQLANTANAPASIPAGSYWAIVLNDVATGSFYEIVYATARSGSNFTVTRGQEGTTARTWLLGDNAYAPVTAAQLGVFQTSVGGGPYVQLSPGFTQSGNIKVTGTINSGKIFANGIDVGGAVVDATTGAFSGILSAAQFQAPIPYGSGGYGTLPIILIGGGSIPIGIGPTSHFSAFGITSTALAIGANGSTDGIFIDQNGNLAATRGLYSGFGVFVGDVAALNFLQSGKIVADTIESTDNSITVGNPSPGLWNLRVAATTQLPSGSVLTARGGTAIGSNISIVLPNYGSWDLEVNVGLIQSTNTNYNVTMSVAGGAVIGFFTNANGTNSSNQVHTILAYAVGHATGGQTVSFSVSSSLGSFNASQPWMIKAIRQ